MQRTAAGAVLAAAAGVAAACGGAKAASAGDTREGPASDSAPASVERPSAANVPTRPGADANAAAAPASGPRVVFIGTSLTAGLGLDPGDAYPAVVERLAAQDGTPIRAVNAGVSGETSAGALRRVDWVLKEPADVVVIETGANDGLRGQSTDSLRANLDAIVARARRAQPRARLALVQMEAPRNFGPAYTTRFHDVYPAVAKADSVVLFPFLLDGVAGVPRLNQADGVHPTAEGARRVGATVWRALKPLVAQPARVAAGR